MMNRHQEKILQAAESLLLEKGWHSLSIRNLGKVLGTSGQAIYKHFKDKDEILQSLILGHYHDFLCFVEEFSTTYIKDSLSASDTETKTGTKTELFGLQLEADGMAYLRYWMKNPRWFDLFQEWVKTSKSLRFTEIPESRDEQKKIHTDIGRYLNLHPNSPEVHELAWELQSWWYGLALAARTEVDDDSDNITIDDFNWSRFDRSIRRSIKNLGETK